MKQNTQEDGSEIEKFFNSPQYKEFQEKLKDYKEGKMVLLYKWQVEELCKASYNKAVKDCANIFRHIRYIDTNITDHLGSIIGDGIKEVNKLRKTLTPK